MEQSSDHLFSSPFFPSCEPGLQVIAEEAPLSKVAFSYSWGGRQVQLATSFAPLTRNLLGLAVRVAAGCWVGSQAPRWVVGAALTSLVLYRVISPAYNYLCQEAKQLTPANKVLGTTVALTTSYFYPFPAALYLGSSYTLHLLHKVQEAIAKQNTNRDALPAPCSSSCSSPISSSPPAGAGEAESSEAPKKGTTQKALSGGALLSTTSTEDDAVMVSWTWGGTRYQLSTTMNQAARTLTSVALHTFALTWFGQRFRNLLIASLIAGFFLNQPIAKLQKSFQQRLAIGSPRLKAVARLALPIFTLLFAPRAVAVYYGIKIGSWLNPLWNQVKASQDL